MSDFMQKLLFVFAIIAAYVNADDDLRDAGDLTRNFLAWLIGFGCGLVIVFVGLCCWYQFETFNVCQGKRHGGYKGAAQTGRSDD